MDRVETEAFNLTAVNFTYFNGYDYGRDLQMARRTVYDYEAEYYLESDGGVEIDGKFVAFESGSINFRRPGQVVRGVAPYKCYCVCIDLLGDRRKVLGSYHFGKPEYAQKNYQNKILDGIPGKLPAEKSAGAGEIMRRIRDNCAANDVLLLKSDLYRLLHALYSAASEDKIACVRYHASVQRAASHIRENFTSDIDINALARRAGLSANYFYKVFKDAFGVTPNRYILMLRLEKAKNLLRVTNLSVAQIGSECGFFDNAYFSYVFRREAHVTPKQYRAQEPI
ncbi:MAG: AraC family transcriptional regulator [Clostridiales bacterium]|jgi:AraC-like DNA-binding protein|nr:AraC family transcriptional regulator [Clostridiales bacterium]